MNLRIKAGTPRTLDSDDDPTFERWMERIDALVFRACGLSVYDLPDCMFADWYECRLRPIYAAKRALKRAGADFFE